MYKKRKEWKKEKNKKKQRPANKKISRLAVDRRFVSYLAEVNVLALLTNWFLSVADRMGATQTPSG